MSISLCVRVDETSLAARIGAGGGWGGRGEEEMHASRPFGSLEEGGFLLTRRTFSERELFLTSVSLGTSPRGVSARDPVHPQRGAVPTPPTPNPFRLLVAHRMRVV